MNIMNMNVMNKIGQSQVKLGAKVESVHVNSTNNNSNVYDKSKQKIAI